MNYVPLQVKSSYSLLQSPIRIPELVHEAKKRGYTSLALTDENILYGAVDFYNAAQKEGIKPLIGMQLKLGLGNIDGTNLEILLLAKDNVGYQNLMQISTLHQIRDNQQHPLTVTEISQFFPSLFAIIPPQVTVFGQIGNTQQFLQKLKGFVDKDSLFLGTNLEIDSVKQDTLKQLGEKEKINLVAVSPVEYLNSEDLFATKVLQAIDANVHLENIKENSRTLGKHFLRENQQVVQDYQAAGLGDAVEKSNLIAEKSNVNLEFKAPVLPHFPTPEGKSSAIYLKQLCIQGLRERKVAPGISLNDYQSRLAKELKVIHEMGFDDYFLIVWDVMQYAHNHQITTDPGRGSAAGSLVAYALAITDVDPLQYGLLFERFLNPERAQMPDIDLDIPDNRRDEILDYIHDKYGHHRVAQIITFGTLAAKQVLRDVSRVFGLNKFAVNELTSALPHGLHITLAGSFKESQSLRNLLNDHENYRLLFNVAQALEGLPRHYSTHAAGVVLSEKPLDSIVPLQNGSEGLLMTQFPKDTVEKLGLLKMDFLGLKNLSIMDNTLELIHQENPKFDLKHISLNDPGTLSLFQSGRTDGVFQFESAGIRDVLVNLHPDNFEDIVAVNALYRPGPLENIPHFIARKHGKESYRLLDESLRPILAPTYGILVYQEQVMQLASAMAGFTLGEADLLRRAISKKKRETMESMRSKFLNGALEHGYSLEIAEQVFNYIDQFANYGFNRSHAVAYSKMAFQMAYLKANYSPEFFTSLLNSETNIEKLKNHVQDAHAFGVKLIGPRINQSQVDFSLNGEQVYFGLSSIKGLRRDFIRQIINEREQNGPYKDLRNFISRLPVKWQRAELIEPLVYSGTFDGLGYNRAEMVDAIPMLISGIQLFDNAMELENDPALQSTIEERKEFPLTERLAKENEYLGVYLSGHPVTQYQQLASTYRVITVNQLKPNMKANLLVLVNKVKVIHTKKDHRQMAFVSGTDQTGEIELTIFPRQYDRFSKELESNNVLLIAGHAEQREGHGLQVIVDKIANADTLRKEIRSSSSNERWVLRIQPEKANEETMGKLFRFMNQYRGNIPVVLYYPATDKKIMQPRSRWLGTQSQIKEGLKQILGQQNVVLQKVAKNN